MEVYVMTDAEMSAKINALAEDTGVQFADCCRHEGEGFFRVNDLKTSDLVTMAQNPLMFHVVYVLERRDAEAFAQKLEFTHFPPKTPANSEFHMAFFKWRDITWQIITLPIYRKNDCIDIAKQLGMRLSNGPPTFFKAPGLPGLGLGHAHTMPKPMTIVAQFPLNSKRVFGIQKDHGDRVGPTPVAIMQVPKR